jgi:hypothetical protein
MRIYIKKKYGILAIESTFQELKNILDDKYSMKISVRLFDLLQICEWIKFKPEGEIPENLEGVWNEAYSLVTHEL